MRILLQFPEGLKREALAHARKLESEGNEVFISASPSFGACDLAIDEAKRIGAEKLVHFGHAEFGKVDFNVEYVERRIDAPLDVLKDSLGPLEGMGSICLMTTIQHVQQLPQIVKFYEENGKQVHLVKPSGLARNQGQILGCDCGNVPELDGKVDAFVYFGGGVFHPIGALLKTTKPFITVDPFRNSVEFLGWMRDSYVKRAKGRILASLHARRFGVLVSTKNGQFRLELAKALKAKIEGAGLEAAILVSNTFDFDSVSNLMEFDAFVSTACPRLALDDNERLRKPLLNPEELESVLALKAGKK